MDRLHYTKETRLRDWLLVRLGSGRIKKIKDYSRNGFEEVLHILWDLAD